MYTEMRNRVTEIQMRVDNIINALESVESVDENGNEKPDFSYEGNFELLDDVGRQSLIVENQLVALNKTMVFLQNTFQRKG